MNFFSNNENDVWALSKGLQTVLFHAPIIYPYKYKEIQLDPSSLTKYVGKYGSLKVYVKDKSLYLSDISGEEEVKLLPESITRFFYEGENDRQIEFAIDEKQEVNRVWLIRAGIKKEINYTH